MNEFWMAVCLACCVAGLLRWVQLDRRQARAAGAAAERMNVRRQIAELERRFDDEPAALAALHLVEMQLVFDDNATFELRFLREDHVQFGNPSEAPNTMPAEIAKACKDAAARLRAEQTTEAETAVLSEQRIENPLDWNPMLNDVEAVLAATRRKFFGPDYCHDCPPEPSACDAAIPPGQGESSVRYCILPESCSGDAAVTEKASE